MAKKKQTDASKVEQVVAGFTSSWNYCSSSYHDKWRNSAKLYNSERVHVGYNGISDTFVPMSFSTVETMVSATAGDKPVVEYVPTKAEQNTNTEVLNGLFSYYWDLDNWTNKKIMSVRQYFKLGSTVEYFYWDIDHPVMQLIPVRDFFIDPTATFLSYQDASYMGYRFLANKEELMSEEIVDIDEESKTYGELIPKYKNLKKLDTQYDSGEQTDKQKKDTHMGSTLDKTAQEGQIEVLCYWTKDKVIYVGNREQVIYEAPNYFKERQQFLGWENPTGMYPFSFDSYLADESQIYGKSVLDSIAKPQELLNDITNQNIDAVSWSLDPIMELDPQYSSYIDKIANVVGAVYPFKPGSYKAVQKPIVPSNAFNERTNIKNEIRETTAVDEIIKGVQTPSRTTATEIKAQVASAGRRFDLVVKQLEDGGYYTMAKIVFQMVRMYVTAPTMYRVVGEHGVNWQTFDPEQFEGDYEPRVKLAVSIEAEKTNKMRNIKEMYTALLGSPFIEQRELAKTIVERAFDLSPEQIAKLVKTEEAMAQSMQGMGGGAPNEDQEPKELINYKDAPPDVQAQMEQAAGYEPSATHGGSIEGIATRQFKEQATDAATGLALPGSPPGQLPPIPQQQQPPGQQF